jgi:hypothetical protein
MSMGGFRSAEACASRTPKTVLGERSTRWREEHVGGLCFDVVGLEHVGREVAEVLGDDDLRAGSDGGGEDVAVVGVG